MEYIDAKTLLPQFRSLIGVHSKAFDQKVQDVFIGYIDAILSRAEYGQFKIGHSIPTLPLDAGRYTLCAGLEKGNICSVRKLIESNELSDQFTDIDLLDFVIDPADNNKRI